MLSLIVIVSLAAVVRAGVQLVSLWGVLPRDNRDFGLV
jgi:hypothetical protein